MANLILLRHGQSVWNKSNLFTGWVDVPLSKKGIEEATLAGKRLADQNVDVMYVSALVRSQMTAYIAMAENRQSKIPRRIHKGDEAQSSWYEIGLEGSETLIPVYEAWELNERMYGALQGKNKQQTIDKYGAEQVRTWRRSFATCPPGGESLELTAKRAIPFFTDEVLPSLGKGKDVFVCAHGNSLRSIVMYIEKLTNEEVLKLEIATGDPILYEYTKGSFQKKSV